MAAASKAGGDEERRMTAAISGIGMAKNIGSAAGGGAGVKRRENSAARIRRQRKQHGSADEHENERKTKRVNAFLRTARA